MEVLPEKSSSNHQVGFTQLWSLHSEILGGDISYLSMSFLEKNQGVKGFFWDRRCLKMNNVTGRVEPTEIEECTNQKIGPPLITHCVQYTLYTVCTGKK